MAPWYENARQLLIPTYDRIPIHFPDGEGPYLYDGDGARYLDALAGIAVNVLGYRHPRIVGTAKRAVEDVLHVSNLFHIEPQYRLAEALSERGFESAAFFCNSGAESNEAAIKFARRWSRRHGSGGHEILTFEGSFHGRTYGALSATGQTKYHQGFSPMLEGFRYLPYNDVEALHDGWDDLVCAVLLEPIQGEGGVIPAQPRFMKEVRKLCDQHHALMMVDEVQTGMGRTGSFFGYQNYGVTPDVVTLAKGIAGGFPMGALLVRSDRRDGLQSSEHASTFGGNPFVSRMALETVHTIVEEELVTNARDRGQQLREGLEDCSRRFDPVDSPTGNGLMLSLPVSEPLQATDLMHEARNHGLIVGVAGENRLRFVPPLILSEENVNEVLERLVDTLKEAVN